MLIAKLLEDLNLRQVGGKKIGGALYVHKTYLSPIADMYPDDIQLICGPKLRTYLNLAEFLKVTRDSITLVEVMDLQEYEPVITKTHKYNKVSGQIKTTTFKGNNPIYHHVWMMFPDDTPIIDTELNKIRSIWWKQHLGVNPKVSSRIGRLKYWEHFVSSIPSFPDKTAFDQQSVTSKNTSVNAKKLPVGLSHAANYISDGDVLLDYGCGRYRNGKDFVESLGAYYSGFDPFHASVAQNALAQILIEQNSIDVIVCSNVLNVLPEDVLVDDAIKLFIELLVGGAKVVVISIYEGDRTGLGRLTGRDRYQRNELTSAYKEKIRRFDSELMVGGSGNVITIQKQP